MTLHLIAEDLEQHAWYSELVESTVADVEAFATRWAAFEDFVASFAGDAPDRDDPLR